MADKIDGNDVELRIAVEPDNGTIDANTAWLPIEPNSFGSFGPTYARVARQPIAKGRRRKKGSIVGVDVVAEDIEQDLTPTSLEKYLSPLMFCDPAEKATTKPLYDAVIEITGVTASDDVYAAASGLGIFKANDLIFADKFAETANNGLKLVTAADADGVTVSTALADETPSEEAYIQVVGHRFVVATVTVDADPGVRFPKLTRASGTKSFLDLGLQRGSWIYIGGDATVNQFATAVNNGFKRVRSVTETEIIIDKSASAMADDAGTGKLIDIYLATEWMDKGNPVRRFSQLERTLGSDGDGVMSEYVKRAIPEDFELSLPLEDKVMFTVGYIGSTYEPRPGSLGVKAGVRPTLDASKEQSYNTSTDIASYKMTLVSEVSEAPTPLFGYATEMTLSVANNLEPNKALGVFGSFDISAGIFEVGAEITGYFTTLAAIVTMESNPDVTIHTIITAHNSGYVFDAPLVGIAADSGLAIELNTPITVPLSSEVVENAAGYTMGAFVFRYLPTVAAV